MHTTLQVTKCSCQHLSSDSNSCQTKTDDRQVHIRQFHLVGVTWWQRVVVMDLRLQKNVIPLGQNKSQIVKTNIETNVHSFLTIPYHSIHSFSPSHSLHLHPFTSIRVHNLQYSCFHIFQYSIFPCPNKDDI